MATRLKAVNEVDCLTVTVITDNYYDARRPNTKISTPFHSRPGSIIHAEYGLSYHVETVTLFAREMPEQFILDTAGTAYRFAAQGGCRYYGFLQ